MIAGNSDGKGDNVNRSLDPSSTSSSGSSRPENSKEQAEAIAAAAGGFGAVGYGSSTSKGANATTGNANLASESGKTGYHDGSKNDLSKKHTKLVKPKLTPKRMLQQVMFLEPGLTKLVRIKLKLIKCYSWRCPNWRSISSRQS